MTACTQPACTGTIVDGYCDICGMPPEPAGSTSAAPAAPASSPAPARASLPTAGLPCAQPGCTGHIVDGYCDVCGSPAAGANAAGSGGGEAIGGIDDEPTAAGPLGSPDSSVATAAQIGSAAIGSRRLGGTTATRRIRTGSQRLRAARIGAGLTQVPPAPAIDPEAVILKDPAVAENKRFCPSCGAEVGRSVDGRPGRTEGFCPKCRNPYSFDAKLKPGDLVAGQYEVAGALAHGGLGWIYLARDRNVSDRWVVLKGLLNSGDQDALAAAIAERQFLAQVEHPLIVEIYNFVTHQGAGYTVMEYVGGLSLKDILKQRMTANQGAYDPLPVDQALAYILEILPAFQYLHDLGLVYCDFKPDNLIQVGDAVKLIDLGGVRRIDDDDAAIYGTLGYQAPEVAEAGPSVASDIYTIGRTLLVLTMEFRGYQGRYLHSLPPVDSAPVFQANDSFYWLVAKCCAVDPSDRFASADELRTQLLGVLREVVARATPGTALTSAASLLFHTPIVASARLQWSDLPRLRPDSTDPQHAWLSTLPTDDPEQALRDLDSAPEDTAEVRLARAYAALELGYIAHVHKLSQEMLQADPWEWRALWIDGLASLHEGKTDAAQAAFNAVYQQVPGELAPKLALALACESGGLGEVAEGLYATCADTDATYVAPAAFGMARVRAARRDVQGAIAALDFVPRTSRNYPEARRQRSRLLLQGAQGNLQVLAQAYDSASGQHKDSASESEFTIEILGQALDVVRRSGPQQVAIGPFEAQEERLRDGIEAAYRSLARETTDRQQRIMLVNAANEVRNWTAT